mgnify:CR=1 FL=1
MIDKTIIIFSYEFPSTNTSKEYIFFKNELREICKNFSKVVIVPIKRPEGYTLTRLKVLITSIYPSNQATRTQIEGRINRIGQKANVLEYRIIHAGILTNIMNNHDDAKSLEIALIKMSKYN